MTVTFHNVTVVVEAADSRIAYTRLCDALSRLGSDIEWETDTYSEEDGDEKSTVELFPQSD